MQFRGIDDIWRRGWRREDGDGEPREPSPWLFPVALLVLWGLLIAIINPFVPLEWFWVVYSLQIINMSGAAGDLFVTIKFSGFPKDILIRDYGVSMTVFSKE